jgi:hypothetical protein
MQQIIIYLLLVSGIHFGLSFNPSCTSCKWFIPNKRDNNDYGLCGLYKQKYDVLKSDIIIYEFARHCRNNESMCGEDGYMYEKKESNNKNKNDVDHVVVTSELNRNYEELQNATIAAKLRSAYFSRRYIGMLKILLTHKGSFALTRDRFFSFIRRMKHDFRKS